MKIKCVIVDDEQLAREMLKVYISKIPKLELVAACRSAAEAKKVLLKENIDLFFLDIQMPQQSGIDFWEELKDEKPAVIFTTAYSDYALKSYELEAVDYLLKPIAFNRFELAVDKVLKSHYINQKIASATIPATEEKPYIIVHAEHKHHKIMFKDIIYIESLKEYVRYHTTQGRIMEHNSLKKLEKLLPSSSFLRIHRSYIVASNYIQSYENGNLLLQQTISLPIGKTYKKEILNLLFKQ